MMLADGLWRMIDATYGDLEHELLAILLEFQRVQNGRELGGVKLDCKVVSTAIIRL